MMILTIDKVPVPIPKPVQTLSCILCNSIISFENKDPSRLFKHLQEHHQVHLNHNLLLSINLIDNDLIGKVISAGCQSLDMSSSHSSNTIDHKEKITKNNKVSKNKTVKYVPQQLKNAKTTSVHKTILKDDIEQLAFDEDKILSKYFSVLEPMEHTIKEEISEDYSQNDDDEDITDVDNVVSKTKKVVKDKTPEYVSKNKITDYTPNSGMHLEDIPKQVPVAEDILLPKPEISTTHEIFDNAPKSETPENCSFDKNDIVMDNKPKVELNVEYYYENATYYKKRKCPFCREVLSTLKSLSSHVRTKHGPQNDNLSQEDQFCHQCNIRIEMVDNDTLIKHYHEIHAQESRCQFCKKLFLSKNSFNKHIQRHHETESSDEILSCVKCNFSTFIFGEYGRHKKACDKVCGVCEKMFPNKFLLKRHVNAIHLGSTETTMCPHCGISLNKFSIYQHVARYHSDKRFKCEDCDYTTPIHAYVKRHYKHKHGYVITPCDDCGKEVKFVEKHKKESCSARSNKKRIQCKQCDKTFGYQVGLDRHVKNIHMDMKDIFCNLCDYKTYSNGNFNSHYSRVHEGNSPKTTCIYCVKSVSTSGMDWHINIYHSHLLHQKDPKAEKEDAKLDES